MARSRLCLVMFTAALFLNSGARADNGIIKVGLILPYSGLFADIAVQIDNGIRLFMKERGDLVAGRRIEVIRRDVGGPAPDIARRIANELVVRDSVDILAGFALTPNAIAVAEVSKQATKFMVVMNAAAGALTTRSPYIVRTSATLQQSAERLGEWAAKHNIRRVVTLVSNFAPGLEAEAAFIGSFTRAGGVIAESIRMPANAIDFSAYVQRVKDIGPEALYVFVPGGAQAPALAKSLADRGVNGGATKILGHGEITDEIALKSAGNSAIGIITAHHYDYNLESELNRKFVEAYRNEFRRNPDVFSVGGYDGMRLIYDALERTGGDTRADLLVAAATGGTWASPRGTITIDPDSREPLQTIYIRRVESLDGILKNVVVEKMSSAGIDKAR